MKLVSLVAITLALAIAFVIWTLASVCERAHAGERDATTFRDRSGNIVGTSRVDSNGTTTFRDRSLNVTGTARTDSNGTTTFRDRGGNVTGTARTR
jgi:hypothetical protein